MGQYIRHSNKECEGQTIETWATGESAEYGWGYINDLDGCKAMCAAHPECDGFVLSDYSQQCSKWKRGPFSLPSDQGHHCYEKVKAGGSTDNGSGGDGDSNEENQADQPEEDCKKK